MTLDEAIKHAEEVAEEKDMQAGFDTDYLCYQMSDTERNQCKKCAEEHHQLAEWLEELKRLREQARWIPVSERLPKKGGYYLTTNRYHEVYSDYWEGTRFDCTDVVIAWMPLPKPFKPQESEVEE